MTHPLSVLLSPKRVAVVGLSDDAYCLANQTYDSLNHYGFKGEVIGVGHYSESKQPRIGAAVWPAVSEIHQPIDLAIVSQPIDQLKDTIIDCGYAGVKAVICLEDPRLGKMYRPEQTDSIKSACTRAEVRLIGPISGAYSRPPVGLHLNIHQPPTLAGHIGLLGGSAGVINAASDWLALRHQGVSLSVMTGAEWNMSLTDWLPILAKDRQTKVIGLDLTISQIDPDFLTSLRMASAVKPVVILSKQNDTTAQTQLARQAIIQHGGIAATSLEEFCHMLLWLDQVQISSLTGLSILDFASSHAEDLEHLSVHSNDIAVVSVLPSEDISALEHAAGIVHWQRQYGHSVVVILDDQPQHEDFREFLSAQGILVCSMPDTAHAVVNSISNKFRPAALAQPTLTEARTTLPRLLSNKTTPGQATFLAGPSAKPIFKQLGIPTSAGSWVKVGQQLSRLPQFLTWPLKITAVDPCPIDLPPEKQNSLIHSSGQLHRRLEQLGQRYHRIYLQSQPTDGIEIRLHVNRSDQFGILTQISVNGLGSLSDTNPVGVGILNVNSAEALIITAGIDQIFKQWPKSGARSRRQLVTVLIKSTALLHRSALVKHISLDSLLVGPTGLLLLDGYVVIAA